jgi:sigma-B regulation protein RsbU (phosphoserine phosphatase)
MATTTTDVFLRDQLLDRRERLESAITGSSHSAPLLDLLKEVDDALERMQTGTYGICEVCNESIEPDRLIADPLIRLCLPHLTPAQQRALEQDLELAAQIQRELIPKPRIRHGTWEICCHYEPLGLVSGDYCDVIVRDPQNGQLFFALGDASGKGVAASMLMSHLHAILRTLVTTHAQVQELVERAGHIFRDSVMAPYFATLVVGSANSNGRLEICNAGHCPPILLREGQVSQIQPNGLPLGLFAGGDYSSETLELARGETLFLYTDGLVEARSPADEEYGEERLLRAIDQCRSHELSELLQTCRHDLVQFRSGAAALDDLTLMALRRVN